VAGGGYGEFNYDLNENHKIVTFGHQPADFGVSVLQGLGVQFIDGAARARRPFMLEIAPFAPHYPYAAAPEDSNSFPNLRAPRDPAFNRLPRNAPRWIASRARLAASNVASIDAAFRKRVQSVQSVDRMIGVLEQELASSGEARNTYFVFSSDNGLHMGEYTLNPGKLTAYDIDIKVPLIVTGPGVPHGVVNPAVVQNIDLAPTFESIGGLTPPATVDGRSLYPLWLGTSVPWRRTALTEHLGLDMFSNDPDFQSPQQGDPPSYAALRTATYTYVDYRDGEREFYNRVTDPWELDNIYNTLTKAQVAALDAQVQAMTTCHGATACWTASLPAPGPA
jgi:arylsulfatase A-like enzyme